MSLFLGKIHFWLFDKILWFDSLEDELLNICKMQNIEIEDIDKKYGERLKNKNLEEIIDKENIHGWLQERIFISEGRNAFLTSLLINKDKNNIEKIKEVYINQGIKAGNEFIKIKEINNAKEMYQAINDYILDGMPCDRVNDVFTIEDDLVEWKRTKCVHKDLWNKENIDVNIFYDLRDEWIKSFIKTTNDKFEYVKENEVFKIREV